MAIQTFSSRRLSRRSFLLSSTACLATSLASPGASETHESDSPLGEPFDFDRLSERAAELASTPYVEPTPATGLTSELTYDLYRQVAFDPDQARWQDTGSDFRLHAFHMGWLYELPVLLYDVHDGLAQPMVFTTDDFDYRNEAEGVLPEHAELPGVSGFRLHWPLNRADVRDELLVFQGASYFRALGRGNAYGQSARGLAIATASDQSEEFPRFSEFYLERPGEGAQHVTLYALLESPSVAGAYRFDVTPGEATTMDVTARLHFREDVPHFGVAPLTSMYLYSESNRSGFDDYRPQVHDTDGLVIEQRGGDHIWRALANPPVLSASHFAETSPQAFGLYQRDREYDSYQDPGARYHERPSLRVEPLDHWGDGDVRLVEIPTDLEVYDNIVAYWSPRGGAAAGDTREYRYRLHWGMLPPDPRQVLAYVDATRTGVGGVSGVPQETPSRKFVLDFMGGLLAAMGPDAKVTPVITAHGARIVDRGLYKVEETGGWRLNFDLERDSDGPVELMAHITGYGRKLSEVWLYQWIEPS
jgi:glucans biosynthesis protein